MPKIKLTDRFIEHVSPPKAGYRLYWDTELTGFAVCVYAPSPRHRLGDKSYVVMPSKSGANRKRRTLAKCSLFSVAEARERGAELMRRLIDGRDPLPLARMERAAQGVTLAQAWTEYMDNRALSEASLLAYRRALKNDFADWYDKPLASITPLMVKERHQEITKRSKSVADNVLKILRTVLEYASSRYEGAIQFNPVTRAMGRRKMRHWNNVPARQRTLRGDELAKWYRAVLALDERNERGSYNPAPEVTRDYLLLLLFTGLRSGECAKIKRTDIRLDRKLLIIPAENAKSNRTLELPLTETHIAILKRRLAALEPDDDYIFPPARSGPRIRATHQFRQIASTSGVEFIPHDLRRTFISVAESLDLSPYVLKALVNHSVGSDVTGGYVIIEAKRLREAMERIVAKLLSEARPRRLKAVA